MRRVNLIHFFLFSFSIEFALILFTNFIQSTTRAHIKLMILPFFGVAQSFQMFSQQQSGKKGLERGIDSRLIWWNFHYRFDSLLHMIKLQNIISDGCFSFYIFTCRVSRVLDRFLMSVSQKPGMYPPLPPLKIPNGFFQHFWTFKPRQNWMRQVSSAL